jgi:hypothetical protein
MTSVEERKGAKNKGRDRPTNILPSCFVSARPTSPDSLTAHHSRCSQLYEAAGPFTGHSPYFIPCVHACGTLPDKHLYLAAKPWKRSADHPSSTVPSPHPTPPLAPSSSSILRPRHPASPRFSIQPFPGGIETNRPRTSTRGGSSRARFFRGTRVADRTGHDVVASASMVGWWRAACPGVFDPKPSLAISPHTCRRVPRFRDRQPGREESGISNDGDHLSQHEFDQ